MFADIRNVRTYNRVCLVDSSFIFFVKCRYSCIEI